MYLELELQGTFKELLGLSQNNLFKMESKQTLECLECIFKTHGHSNFEMTSFKPKKIDKIDEENNRMRKVSYVNAIGILMNVNILGRTLVFCY